MQGLRHSDREAVCIEQRLSVCDRGRAEGDEGGGGGEEVLRTRKYPGTSCGRTFAVGSVRDTVAIKGSGSSASASAPCGDKLDGACWSRATINKALESSSSLIICRATWELPLAINNPHPPPRSRDTTCCRCTRERVRAKARVTLPHPLQLPLCACVCVQRCK